MPGTGEFDAAPAARHRAGLWLMLPMLLLLSAGHAQADFPIHGGLVAVLGAVRLDAGTLLGLGLALLVSLSTLYLRALRWIVLTRALGLRIPLRANICIYLAGFAFTASPGKAGELFRNVYLRRFGGSHLQGSAIFVMERACDFLALAVLCAPALARLPLQTFERLAAAALILGAAFKLATLAVRKLRGRPAPALDVADTGESAPRRPLAGLLRNSLPDLKVLLHPPLVALSVAVSLAAWSIQAGAVYLVARTLGAAAALADVVSAYALSLIAGVLSLIPGGLGAADATLVLSLQSDSHIGLSQAIAVDVLVQIITLWSAVCLGAVYLPFAGRSSRAHQGRKDANSQSEGRK